MNITDFHGKTAEELAKLNTRHLDTMLKHTRRKHTCGCTYHCGDEYLSEDEREFNRKQNALAAILRPILATREHVPGKAEGKALRREAAKRGR